PVELVQFLLDAHRARGAGHSRDVQLDIACRGAGCGPGFHATDTAASPASSTAPRTACASIGAVLVTINLPVRALTSTLATPGIWLTSPWMSASQCLQLIPLTRYSLAVITLPSIPHGGIIQSQRLDPWRCSRQGRRVASAQDTQWRVSRLHHAELM